MARFLQSMCLGVFLSIFISCGQQQPFSNTSLESITPKNVKVGKWLISISVGGNVDTSSTLALRNVMTDVFSKTKGGVYEHAIDMSDKSSSSIRPTKINILKEVNTLKEKIKKFKVDNPTAKTMIVFSLTGHGMTSGGVYYYQTSSGSLSGKEIVDMIYGFETDETVLVLQSCQSGSLPNHHFRDNAIAKLALNIKLLAYEKDMVLSVVTPVTENVNSPLDTWENDILKLAFDDSSADKNKDFIVSYEEWKNFVLVTSCQHPDYIPGNGSGAGINPQFYDPKVPAALPLYLTIDGVQQYENNTLVLPDYPLTPSVIWPETIKICKSNNDDENQEENNNENQNQDEEESLI